MLAETVVGDTAGDTAGDKVGDKAGGGEPDPKRPGRGGEGTTETVEPVESKEPGEQGHLGPNMVPLFVITLKGKTFNVLINKNSTVLQLKQEIETQHGVPVWRQRLIHAGQLLENDKSITEHYCLQRETAVHLVEIVETEVPVEEAGEAGKAEVPVEEAGEEAGKAEVPVEEAEEEDGEEAEEEDGEWEDGEWEAEEEAGEVGEARLSEVAVAPENVNKPKIVLKGTRDGWTTYMAIADFAIEAAELVERRNRDELMWAVAHSAELVDKLMEFGLCDEVMIRFLTLLAAVHNVLIHILQELAA